jgi:hypothetical protein
MTLTIEQAIAESRRIEEYDAAGNVPSVFTDHAWNTHRLLLDVAEAYNNLRRIRKLGLACEVDYEDVNAALQAFAAYMSGETK